MTDAALEETTDAWPWSKIMKHVFLPKPKGSPRSGKKEKVARILTAAVFGVVGWSVFGGSGSLPSCSSTDSKTLVGQIINDSPIAKMSGAKFVSLKNISEQGYNKDAGVRSCTATLVTTAGEDNIQYSVNWQNKAKGTFEVQARIM